MTDDGSREKRQKAKGGVARFTTSSVGALCAAKGGDYPQAHWLVQPAEA